MNNVEKVKIHCYALGISIAAAQWDESQVNRDESGRFAKSSSSSNSPVKSPNSSSSYNSNLNLKSTPSFSEYKKNKSNQIFNNTETYKIITDAVSDISWEGDKGEIVKELLKQEMDKTIQQAAQRIIESREATKLLNYLLEPIDPGTSDLGSELLEKAKSKNRLADKFTKNKALLEYVSVCSGVAILGTVEKLVEADIGRDVKSIEDVKKEMAKTASQVLEIENEFVASQIKGMQKLAQKSADKVSEIVTKDLPKLVKEWKEQHDKNNKNQVESLRNLIKNAQEEQGDVEEEEGNEDEFTVQSMALDEKVKKLGEIFKRMKKLDLEKLTRALEIKNLDNVVEKILNELLV